MDRIDQYNRATVAFTLAWNSEHASHREQYHADAVNFWRDVLDPSLVKTLLGKGVGDRGEGEILAARFPLPYDPRKRVLVRPEQFQGTDTARATVAFTLAGPLLSPRLAQGCGRCL